MRYFILIYLVTGLLSIAVCIWISRSRSRKVPSILEDVLLDPVMLIVIVSFWPLSCVWDLLGIAYRRKEKFNLLTDRLAKKREARKAKQEQRAAYRAIIGANGITMTPLCLSGKVDIAGKIWDAQSLDGYIPSNENIVVKNRVRNELKMEPIKKN